ncbi:inositol monophosphatase family protein [Sphingobium subterraneum]|uniref:Fructose-1,6-bisphosphatase/inositol monophosphatase family enzyme n=1 Tax=Sphingobium subterraneum TaxID=627688 RepID=A0A841IW70_9SPHN|nr:inositol monophosphatase family protein [Sphingobium subterraneum]MBB6123169.1 fructose-1,6-bisphosphatase/inositol monophosphatase family enzyme [Sphingobium subterraneum]
MTDISPTLHRGVSDLMQRVAVDIVLPRFQNLAQHEIQEKAADDLVTIADKESEIALNEGLVRLLPEAGLVGEEACAADPSILASAGTGLCWIIDPIDGTGNFAAGRAPFGIMVALANDGVTEAGWIYDPLSGRLCHAIRNKGAFINEEPVAARPTGAERPIAGISTLFLEGGRRDTLLTRAKDALTLVDIPRCAAEQYPRLVLGINDISVFERTLPWDHAAGVLFLNEAGGRVCRNDGSPYRVGDNRAGMLAAATPRLWDAAAEILFD